MKPIDLLARSLAAAFLCAGPAVAQTPSFGVPNAPLPAAAGRGLSGKLWSAVAIESVDDLAAARTYIAANPPNSLFLASTVDYPNGPNGSTLTSATFAEGLGVDAASLSN